MAGITHNSFRVAQRIEARGVRVEAEVRAALDRQAQEMARAVRRRAPNWRSALVNSVNVAVTGEFVREISVGERHGIFQERGIKPGGKGLPRFFDPASASIVAWLESKLSPAGGGGRGRQAFELELRDRYEGLAGHIRAKGMRAQPFVKPAFDERVNGVALALRQAVARGLAGDGATA